MHGLKIMPPSINKSQNVFVSLKNTLYMPFSQIRSVGKAIEENIIEERKKGKYLSFLDFKKRVKVSDSVLEALIFAGCFSEFELTKKTMVDSVNVNSNIYEKYIDDPVFQYDIEYEDHYLESQEKKYLGFNLVYNLFANINKYILRYRAAYISMLKIDSFSKLIVEFTYIKRILTKKGDPMAFITLSDGLSQVEGVLFPRAYDTCGSLIQEHKLFVVDRKSVV